MNVEPTQFFKETDAPLSLHTYLTNHLPFNYKGVNQHSKKTRREAYIVTKATQQKALLRDHTLLHEHRRCGDDDIRIVVQEEDTVNVLA